MPGRLQGRVVLVTGAARGQGRSHAVRAAEEGADVIALDICEQIDSVPYLLATSEDLVETERLVEKSGSRVVGVQADVRDPAALDAAIGAAVGELGRLDAVSINAGIGIPGALLDKDVQSWRDTIDTNLSGAFYTLKIAAQHILAGGRGGSIVLTSSSVAIKPAANLIDYVAAKSGLIGLTRAAALELAPHRIRVNSVHPGTVDAPMLQNPRFRSLFRPDLDEPTSADLAVVTRQLHALPMDWAECEDITNAVLFLLCDESRYITGVQLPVDGGNLLL